MVILAQASTIPVWQPSPWMVIYPNVLLILACVVGGYLLIRRGRRWLGRGLLILAIPSLAILAVTPWGSLDEPTGVDLSKAQHDVAPGTPGDAVPGAGPDAP